MTVIIKKLLFFNVIFIILYTFIFAQYVFENSLVDAQNIGYSVLISIPLSIFSMIFFTYLYSLILLFVINIILVPIIKIQNLSNNVVKTVSYVISIFFSYFLQQNIFGFASHFKLNWNCILSLYFTVNWQMIVFFPNVIVSKFSFNSNSYFLEKKISSFFFW